MKTYLDLIFEAKIVAKDGIVRRKKEHVDRFVPFHSLLARVRKEQYHLIETGDQYVIICNPGVLKIHC